MKNILLTISFIFLSFSLQAEERFITTSDGVKLYVKVKGQGTPCLYLHGGPGSGSYWFEKFFGEFMEQHYTMIYLDQRGVGRSSSPSDGNFSMDRMVLDFEEVRKELNIEEWITWGHSFGGILQMGYIERFPDATKGMIMVNCTLDINQSFCESWSPKAAEFLGNTNHPTCATDTIPVMERMGVHISQLKEKDLFWKMAYADKKYDAVMNATYDDIPHWNFDFGNAALSIEDYWINFKPATANVKIPVLFIYGRTDWMVGPDHYLGVNFPKMTVWENIGGHIPFLENKTDLQEAILDYSANYNFIVDL